VADGPAAAPDPRRPAMTVCRRCGAETTDAVLWFCRRCGAPLESTASGSQSAASPRPATPQPEIPQRELPSAQTSETPGPSGPQPYEMRIETLLNRPRRAAQQRFVLVAATAAVLIALGAVVAVGVLFSGKPASPAKSQAAAAPSAVLDTTTDDMMPSTTDADSDTGTSATGTSATVAPPSGPAAVVEAYYAAIERRDYQTAFNLRADSAGGSVSGFASGYATTASVVLKVTSVNGDTVYIQLTAQQIDGSVLNYSGYYVVRNGLITSANISQNN
jgi:hypothetical protein